MRINTDINLLGGLPDWNLVKVLLTEDVNSLIKDGIYSYTSIKTDKSVTRFTKAIKATLLQNKLPELSELILQAVNANGTSSDNLLLLFWNASANNDLLFYLNEKVYFPAFYSGRVSINKLEIEACIFELREKEKELQKWSTETILTTSRKYLSLLKKFGLMVGSKEKALIHPILDDSMFVLYVYWITAISEKSNLINSKWLNYSFSELDYFLERLMKKKYLKYFNVVYTGDRLNIEPIISYNTIYEFVSKT